MTEKKSMIMAPSNSNTIYTIGYGNRSFDDFVVLLKKFKFDYLIDIRSSPYSKYNNAFNSENLRKELKTHRIGYVLMGQQLGGRPDDSIYYVDGKVDYGLLGRADFYQQGISRLNLALEKGYVVTLMCSELKPHECHRSKLIGRTLVSNNIQVVHIDEKGNLKTQQEVIDILTDHQMTLFDFTSRKKYRA